MGVLKIAFTAVQYVSGNELVSLDLLSSQLNKTAGCGTATCRVFRRPQRPKDDAVVKCQGRNRRLSGPLRFPRYHVHPKRRQSLLARVPGLPPCLLVVRCERPSGQKYCCVCNISAVGVSRTAGFCPMTARPRDFALSGTEQAGSWDIIYSAYGAVVLGTAYRSY